MPFKAMITPALRDDGSDDGSTDRARARDDGSTGRALALQGIGGDHAALPSRQLQRFGQGGLGRAVIWFDLPSAAIWPGNRRSSPARALTGCSGDFADARSNERHRVHQAYTKAHCSQPMDPIAHSDGGDAGRAVCEAVPSFAAMLGEVALVGEDAV